MEIDKYIVDGKVKRSKIASDISKGALSRNDLQELITNSCIMDAYIGNSFNKNMDCRMWNKQYLEKISYAASSEAFNEDYLFHLCDVYEYIESKKQKKKAIVIGSSAGIVIIVLVILAIILSKSNS